MKDLSNEPRIFTHSFCGTSTEVSANIRSNYLHDPYYYSYGMTMCAQCGIVVSTDCTWDETGESFFDYMNRLQQAKGVPYHCVRWGIWIVFILAGAVLGPVFAAHGKGQLGAPWDSLGGICFGGLLALFVGRYIRLLLCRMNVI